MALIAYLMEFKGNYGQHLIIVPNAPMVNWKSELHTWLPSVWCIFYAGGKDYRSKLFSQEIMAMKFNVLVTTNEFIMYDRSRLSKIDWRYIIIDEAQGMNDRESVLARDLDRYRCHRRLLLTGTHLQVMMGEIVRGRYGGCNGHMLIDAATGSYAPVWSFLMLLLLPWLVSGWVWLSL